MATCAALQGLTGSYTAGMVVTMALPVLRVALFVARPGGGGRLEQYRPKMLQPW